MIDFSLFENIDDTTTYLKEATTPTYRNIIFELVSYICKDNNFKRFLSNDASKIRIHHIDSIYERDKNGRMRAINNTPQNLAFVSEKAHRMISKINKQAKTDEEKTQNVFAVKEELPNEVFILSEYLPQSLIVSLEPLADEEQ